MINIENNFKFHPATETTGPQHDSVRKLLGSTAAVLSELIPDSAEKTLAIRKLEEAMFWSNAAIARNQ